MGSIAAAGIGALLIGLAEQPGLVYFPTYGVPLTFGTMVVTLALRRQGLLGKTRAAGPLRATDAAEIVTVDLNRLATARQATSAPRLTRNDAPGDRPSGATETMARKIAPISVLKRSALTKGPMG